VVHWMKQWIFFSLWCISCVFAYSQISQNSRFYSRNKYSKYILHWHRLVLLWDSLPDYLAIFLQLTLCHFLISVLPCFLMFYCQDVKFPLLLWPQLLICLRATMFSSFWRNSVHNLFSHFIAMLIGSTVTTAWRVLGLRIEDTASRYGG
jgi:hypothetical protein